MPKYTEAQAHNISFSLRSFLTKETLDILDQFPSEIKKEIYKTWYEDDETFPYNFDEAEMTKEEFRGRTNYFVLTYQFRKTFNKLLDEK